MVGDALRFVWMRLSVEDGWFRECNSDLQILASRSCGFFVCALVAYARYRFHIMMIFVQI